MKLNLIRQILAMGIAVLALAGCQQNNQSFTLTGELEGITEGKIILTQFMDENQEADTTDIVDGKFVFEGDFPEPTQVMLMVEDNYMAKYFYVENTEMTLKGHADSLYNAVVTGGRVNEDETKYMDGTREFYTKYKLDSLYKLYYDSKDEAIMDQINDASAKYEAEVEAFEKKFIQENSSAYYSAILAQRMSFGLSADQIGEIIAMLDPSLQETELIQGMEEEMEMLRVTDVSVESFTNDVPDVGYHVDKTYEGQPHMGIKYLASFPNDNICALKQDGTITIIDSYGKKLKDFKADLKAKPTSMAVNPDNGQIYVLGTITEMKETKFRGRTYEQEMQIGVECMIYDESGNKIKSMELDDAKTATGAKIVNGKLFIADYRSRRVAVYDIESGKFETSIDDARACCGILDFGVNDQNEILLANLGAFRVQAFDMSGEIKYSFGKRGRGLNDFHGCCNPVNVSYLPNGAIITVEKDPTRIKVYTQSGAHKVEGVEELVRGCSYIPMTVDSNNNLYLASVMSGIVKCSPTNVIP